MTTIARSLHRRRSHRAEQVGLAAVVVATAVYLVLHQDVLMHLNLLVGP